MHTVLSRVLLRLVTFQNLINNRGRVFERCYSKSSKLGMEEKLPFVGRQDPYNGVIVDSSAESACHGPVFLNRLLESLKQWKEENKSAIWFRVDLANVEWVPILVDQGFKFHHAKEDYVTLYRWLPSHQKCEIPSYAHTNLGVGGFVLNEDTGEILVVKDKRSVRSGSPRWKLPGGFVEPGEYLPDAVMREVSEETGIQTEFESVIGFRHSHGYAFGCSDIYVIARLRPLTLAIQKCEREIHDCTWMKVEDFANDPDIFENNRIIAKGLLRYVKNRASLKLTIGEHPITKKPVSIYLMSDTDTS